MGATENPCRRAKKPITPKIKASQTSSNEALSEYAPITDKAKTIGHKIEVGTMEIRAKSFAA